MNLTEFAYMQYITLYNIKVRAYIIAVARQKTRRVRRVLKLRHLRRGREMTQGELAARAGLSKAAICDIERGYRKPSLETAKAIGRVFPEERLESLFDYVEVPA